MARDRCNADELLGNIFEYEIPKRGEVFDTLLSHKNIKIIKIVSSNDIEDIEYIQDEDEWVVLLKGGAKLQINDRVEELKEGDYIFIPSFTPHKVLSVELDTLWLAIHIF